MIFILLLCTFFIFIHQSLKKQYLSLLITVLIIILIILILIILIILIFLIFLIILIITFAIIKQLAIILNSYLPTNASNLEIICILNIFACEQTIHHNNQNKNIT